MDSPAPHQMLQGKRNPCSQSLCPFCLTLPQVAQLLSPLTLLTGGLRMELTEEEWRVWDPHLGVVAEHSYLA